MRLNETGCALFGEQMKPDTGVHWAVLKVIEATEPTVSSRPRDPREPSRAPASFREFP